MVCLKPQSQVSCSLENPHFNMFTLDRPDCVRNRLNAFHVVQGLSAPAGRCSSAPMLRCTLSSRSSGRSLHIPRVRCMNGVKYIIELVARTTLYTALHDGVENDARREPYVDHDIGGI